MTFQITGYGILVFITTVHTLIYTRLRLIWYTCSNSQTHSFRYIFVSQFYMLCVDELHIYAYQDAEVFVCAWFDSYLLTCIHTGKLCTDNGLLPLCCPVKTSAYRFRMHLTDAVYACVHRKNRILCVMNSHTRGNNTLVYHAHACYLRLTCM